MPDRRALPRAVFVVLALAATAASAEPTCADRTAALTGWFEEVQAEGEAWIPSSIKLVQSNLAPTRLPGLESSVQKRVVPVLVTGDEFFVEWEGGKLGAKNKSGAHAALVGQLRTRIRNAEVLSEASGYYGGAPEIVVTLSADVPAAVFGGVVASLRQAKVTRLHLVVGAKSQLTPPAAVSTTAEFAAVGSRIDLALKFDDVFARCEGARKLSRVMSESDWSSLLQHALAEELPKCDCAVDFGVLQNWIWAMHGRLSQPAVTSIEVELGPPVVKKGALVLTAADTWQTIWSRVHALSEQGQPLSVSVAAGKKK